MAQLDGEASAANEGYAITPWNGDPAGTVLGTDRFGKSNGALDSEDRNGNGVLDTPATDTGVVLAPAIGPTHHLASLPLGTSDWTEVTLDITSLVSAYPGNVPYPARHPNHRGSGRLPRRDSDHWPHSRGRVFVHGSALASSSASLSVREVTPEEDTDLDARPFASVYPDVYRKLHGSEGYREDHGIADKSLACTVMSAMAVDEQALARLPISPPADSSAWKQLKLYVLIPPLNTAGRCVVPRQPRKRQRPVRSSTAIPGFPRRLE